MPRNSKPSDSWAALLAKELAPAKKPEGAKRFDEVQEMLKKSGLPHGETSAHWWIRDRIKEGEMESLQIFERDGQGRRKRRIYYVPAK